MARACGLLGRQRMCVPMQRLKRLCRSYVHSLAHTPALCRQLLVPERLPLFPAATEICSATSWRAGPSAQARARLRRQRIRDVHLEPPEGRRPVIEAVASG